MDSFEKILLRLKEQLGVQVDKEVATLLGMTPTAFNARKKRDSFPEDKLLALAARRPELLLDVSYVLTGRDHHKAAAERMATMAQVAARRVGHISGVDAVLVEHTPLTRDEVELLELFRMAPLTLKAKAVELLSGGGSKSGGKSVKVKGNNNRTAGRDYNEKES